MKFGKVFAAAAATSLAVMPIAAQAAGSAGAIRSAEGGVYVERDGALIPATANMELRAGDRVMTRMGGSAQIAYGDCAAPVASASVFTVGATNSCDATARNFASLQDEDDAIGTGAEAGGGFSTGLVAVLAAVAVGLGIYVAADSDSNDAPVSA